MKEAKKFAKEHKVLTAAFAISSAYAFVRTVQSMRREEGDFWPSVNGIGATTSTSTTTSSSHPMNRAPAGDMMKHPTALYGYRSNPHCTGIGSHCSARGNPHCHCGTTAVGSIYGDDTNKSSLSLMGTPNSIKRRTMRSNMENAEVYMSARESHMFSNQRRAEPTAEDVMGDLGMVDTLGATGWI
jgi:hypothetical protein